MSDTAITNNYVPTPIEMLLNHTVEQKTLDAILRVEALLIRIAENTAPMPMMTDINYDPSLLLNMDEVLSDITPSETPLMGALPAAESKNNRRNRGKRS